MGRRIISLVAAVAIAFAAPAAARAVTLTDPQRAARAAGYLRSQQKKNGSIVAFSPVGSTADSVLAFVALGEGRTAMNGALAFLRAQVAGGHVTQLGLEAKVVMAAAAAGLDVRTFGGHNLLASIRSARGPDGHFGTSTVLDDALAVLAIESAGIVPAHSAAVWLLKAQCPDGGWAYDKPYDPSTDDAHCDDGSPTDYFTSDTNTTSYVVQALTAMSDTDWIANPFAFFAALRDGVHHGWPYAASTPGTDANSTALVIQAYRAGGLGVPAGSIAALRALQYPGCGAFAYTWSKGKRSGPDLGATIGAIPGLLRAPFPLRGPVAPGLPGVFSCA